MKRVLSMKMNIRFAAVLLVCVLIVAGPVAVGAEPLTLRVSVPADGVDVPVCAGIELSPDLANVPFENIAAELKQAGSGRTTAGQLVKANDGMAELWWILPQAKANSTSTWIATLKRGAAMDPKRFSWNDHKGQYLDLLFDGRKVTRYMYAHDTSSAQRTFETYKPFHHVYDASGNLLTNGPDGVNPYLKDAILYPHHRGIFIGWNRLTFEGQRCDLWHMPQGHQVHQKFLEQIAGPVLARSTVLIHWNDKEGEPILVERRQTTVFRQGDPTVLLLDFHTDLKAVRSDVFLDGDPEHAGFQYRPNDAVAKGGPEGKAKYLFHQEGIDPKKDRDLPWVAMSYGLSSGRYSVLHMNHPDNPKSTLYSAYRDYGRFGAFFTRELGAGQTLTLGYRIWVGRGELPERQNLANRHSIFVGAPNIQVSKR
jgi:hypothetical protein